VKLPDSTHPEDTTAVQLVDLLRDDISPGRRLRTFFARFWSEPFDDMRAKYNEFVARTPVAPDVSFRETDDPGPGEWAETPGAPADRAIFFTHGGGYGLGNVKAYRNFVSHLASLTKINVFSLEYPLAPEAVAPVALDLAVDAISRLRRNCRVAVVGDSAGGGMTLAATARLVASSVDIAAVVAFSPWTDLTLSGVTMRSMAIGDISLDPEYLRESATQYAGHLSIGHPDASPLFGIPAGMPPTLIQVGTDEVLLDDSRRYAERSLKLGNKVQLEIYEGMHHVFVLNLAELSAARRAVRKASEFLAVRLS
jgi:epsilon-lactone hydrolase